MCGRTWVREGVRDLVPRMLPCVLQDAFEERPSWLRQERRAAGARFRFVGEEGQMNAVPAWLQIAMAVSGVLGVVGGAAAFVFVIWPSIRIQTRFIQSQEKKSVDELIDRL